MDKESNFVELKKSNKIWAIGSIHSNLKSFASIKKFLLDNFEKNDKLVFLGNVIGLGNNSKETLSSVIDLRFNLMSKFKLKPESIIFLRGAQEEMFSKLLQLQLAPNPNEIRGNTYKQDDKCYTYDTVNTKCTDDAISSM